MKSTVARPTSYGPEWLNRLFDAPLNPDRVSPPDPHQERPAPKAKTVDKKPTITEAE